MGATISVCFFMPRKTVKTIKGTTPIYLRITIDGQRFETSIRRQIATDNWHAKLGKAKGITEDVKILNTATSTRYRSRVFNYQQEIYQGRKRTECRNL